MGEHFLFGMKFHDREQGTVAKHCGSSPTHMIPVSKITEETIEKATVTIKFADKVKDTYVKFTDVSHEQGS